MHSSPCLYGVAAAHVMHSVSPGPRHVLQVLLQATQSALAPSNIPSGQNGAHSLVGSITWSVAHVAQRVVDPRQVAQLGEHARQVPFASCSSFSSQPRVHTPLSISVELSSQSVQLS